MPKKGKGGRHGPSIKRPSVYEKLRGQGMSKGKAARISNSMSGGSRKKKK